MKLRERLAIDKGMGYAIPKVADRIPYFLGSITLFGIIIMVVTGLYLSQFYNPDAGSANNLNVTDARLGPLADNGGPTQTMALLAGSPALGAGGAAATLSAGITASQTSIGGRRIC